MFFAIILFIPHLSLSPHSSLMRSKIILAWHSGEYQRSPKWTAIQSMEFPGSLNRWDRYHIIPQLAVCKRQTRDLLLDKKFAVNKSSHNHGSWEWVPTRRVSSCFFCSKVTPFSTSRTVRESVAEVEWNVPLKDQSNWSIPFSRNENKPCLKSHHNGKKTCWKKDFWQQNQWHVLSVFLERPTVAIGCAPNPTVIA